MKELPGQTRAETNGTEARPSREFATAAAEGPARAPDLRSFIHTLEKAGRLVRVQERVDWKLGVGRRTRATRKPLLFENVEDYPGQRVLTNGLADPICIGIALGVDPETPYRKLIADVSRRLATPVPPKLVTTGPVLENIVPASELDLLCLPVPQWSESDAGRYLGTWHLNISEDPGTGRRNAGVYRMQLLGPRRATISASKGSDLARHVANAEAKNAALPMAVAIGAPEAAVIAAGGACPVGMDEFDLAGALQQKPLQVIACGNLQVPASSEIVIEGFIHPGIRVQDGPYLDYYGRANTNPNAFLFEATLMMHRTHPIFRGSAIGQAGAEDHQLFAFLAQLKLVDFHGSRLKQKVQNFLWKRRAFSAVQLAGRLGSTLKRLS